MVSALNGPTLAASRAALSAAMADDNPNISDDAESIEPGEIQEVNMEAQAEGIRTVFSDPTNFNVKVCRVAFFIFLESKSNIFIDAQHPLYSPWTLWFDSPMTKNRNLPQTPISAVPQTPGPLPQTPGVAAAQGWMEDIKRVISFDSVEEFWGYAVW